MTVPGRTGVAVDVVVPTYRRPALLRCCLDALAAQRTPPERIVVALRYDDAASRSVVGDFGGLVTEAVVDGPGLVRALRSAVALTQAEVVAFCDDDAEPEPDWVLRIADAFRDPSLGCLGGRPDEGRPPRPGARVGRINRWGRIVGRHAIGWGPPRDVDVVVGANWAVRASMVAFPRAGVLLGPGAEPHNEVLITEWVRRRGGRVVYDPAVVVRHCADASVLPSGDLALARESEAWVRAVAHNWVVGVTASPSRSRAAVLAYGVLVGMRGTPGLGRAAAALLRGEPEVARRLPASLRGQFAGWRSVRRGAADAVDAGERLRDPHGVPSPGAV